MSPETASDLAVVVIADVERSPARLELTADPQPWYVVVTARRGSEESGASPVLAVQPLALDAPFFEAASQWDESASTPGDRYGSVLARGDFNGDGIDDLVTGTPHDANGAADGGQFELFLGRPGGLPDVNDMGVSPSLVDGRYGAALAVGDFDCDGLDDLAIGHPGGGTNARGRVELASGGPLVTYMNALLAPAAVVGTNLGFGSALSAGDVNDDGCADLLVAERGRPGHVPSVHLFLGTPGGALGLPAYSRLPANGSDASGWGQSVAIADVDGDGRGDSVIGEPAGGPNGTGTLSIFLSPDGLAQGTDPILVLPGDAELQHFGTRLASGDLDGDGFDELLVSTFPEDANPSVYVFAGRAAPESGLTAAAIFESTTSDPQVPLTALSRDVDGDGFFDLFVGDPEQPGVTSDSAGSIALYLGGPAGVSSAAAFTIAAPAGAIHYGHAITAGDFDGDGVIDVVAAAPQTNGARGTAYHHHGFPTRGIHADAGLPREVAQTGAIDPVDAWFVDADKRDHVCDWTFGPSYELTVDPCTQESVGEIATHWDRGTGRFTTRLRVTAQDGRFGDAFTSLTVRTR